MLVPEFIREWFRCHVLRPLLRALGMVIGINPSVGLTTLFVVLVAWVFGLSKLASMVGTHVVAPLPLDPNCRHQASYSSSDSYLMLSFAPKVDSASHTAPEQLQPSFARDSKSRRSPSRVGESSSKESVGLPDVLVR